MQEQKNEFGRFLLQRFFIIISGISVCEFGISLFYNKVLIPLLYRKLDWNILDMTIHRDGNLGNVLLFLGWILLSGVLMLLPVGISSFVQRLAGKSLAERLQLGSGMIKGVGGGPVGGLVYIGYVSIALVLLLGLLLPFLVGALCYRQMVRQRVQELIRADKERQEEEQRKRSLMLSDIAHDLKTPITTVAGYAQALRDGMIRDAGKRQEYLDAIASKSTNMNTLIELLLDYARIDSGGLVLHREMCDVAELVRQLAADMYWEFEEAGIELEVDIPEESCWFSIDTVQFSRVITNLLTNAKKHMETGTRVWICLRQAEGREGIDLLIGDDGVKIPGEIADNIFDPFVMGDTSRNSRGGRGLGLSIAARITELHGGRIYLEQQETKKYTKAFRIEL